MRYALCDLTPARRDPRLALRTSFFMVKMLQLALLNRVPFGKFNRASAFPVVRLRRTGLASELQ